MFLVGENICSGDRRCSLFDYLIIIKIEQQNRKVNPYRKKI